MKRIIELESIVYDHLKKVTFFIEITALNITNRNGVYNINIIMYIIS